MVVAPPVTSSPPWRSPNDCASAVTTCASSGPATGQEATLVPDAGFPFVPVRVASAQTRVSLQTAKALWMSLVAARAVRPIVRAADVVVGIGGYASAPAIVAARRVRTPIVLIEQNSVPGVVNRVAARWAVAVATTFEATASRLPVGHPSPAHRQSRPSRDRRRRCLSRRSPSRSAPRVRARRRSSHGVGVRREPGGSAARPDGRGGDRRSPRSRRHPVARRDRRRPCRRGRTGSSGPRRPARARGRVHRPHGSRARGHRPRRCEGGVGHGVGARGLRGAVDPRAVPLRHRAPSGGQRPRGGARRGRRGRARGRH